MDPRHFWRFWSPLGDKTYSKLNHLVLGSNFNGIEIVIVVIHSWVATRTLDPFVGLAQEGGAIKTRQNRQKWRGSISQN